VALELVLALLLLLNALEVPTVARLWEDSRRSSAPTPADVLPEEFGAVARTPISM
jgi:hypothetical protein